jgi:hypothetical protein
VVGVRGEDEVGRGSERERLFHTLVKFKS